MGVRRRPKSPEEILQLKGFFLNSSDPEARQISDDKSRDEKTIIAARRNAYHLTHLLLGNYDATRMRMLQTLGLKNLDEMYAFRRELAKKFSFSTCFRETEFWTDEKARFALKTAEIQRKDITLEKLKEAIEKKEKRFWFYTGLLHYLGRRAEDQYREYNPLRGLAAVGFGRWKVRAKTFYRIPSIETLIPVWIQAEKTSFDLDRAIKACMDMTPDGYQVAGVIHCPRVSTPTELGDKIVHDEYISAPF